jgi:hypothetical protein
MMVKTGLLHLRSLLALQRYSLLRTLYAAVTDEQAFLALFALDAALRRIRYTDKFGLVLVLGPVDDRCPRRRRHRPVQKAWTAS